MRRYLIYSTLAICVFLVTFFSGKLFETNTFGNYQVKQAAVTGDVSVRSEPGLYWQGFGSITTYPISEDLDFEDANIQVRFNDGSVAKVKGTVKFKLSLKPEIQQMLHRDYAGFHNVVSDLIQKNVQEALGNTATLMVAEDSYSARRAEFSDIAKRQLEQGIFRTETKNVDSVDENGTKFKKRVIELVLGSDGNPIVQKESLLKRYEIEILQFVVNDFEYDSKINELIAKKKEAEQVKVVAAANAEKAKQDALTAEAEGSAAIAKAKAEAEVQKMTEVVEAQKRAEVAKLEAERAKFEAIKIKEQGEAEAYANKLKVQAGLTPLERATIEKETQIGVAAELAKVQFPQTMVISGGSGTNGGVNPFDAVGLKALYDLSNQMSSTNN
jgi:regulator of protease activity HflC (stomatin/prohibitin superfamily)